MSIDRVKKVLFSQESLRRIYSINEIHKSQTEITKEYAQPFSENKSRTEILMF